MKKIIYSLVITALAMPMAAGLSYVNLKNSDVKNVNQNVTNTAQEGSKINSGITAKGSVIANSKIENTNLDVTNKASGASTINSGVEANNATIKDSKIENRNITVQNTATAGSVINSGIFFQGTGSKLTT